MTIVHSILVTGGAGYVGSHAVEALCRAGYLVTVVDDLSQGHKPAVPAAADFVMGNAGDRPLLDRLLAARPYHAVMHFAARSLVGESMRDPGLYLTGNVQVAQTVIDAAIAHKVPKLVLSSTANIFASSDGRPITENSPIDPGSPYGEGKYMVERLLHWADRCHGLRSAALRYFNAAGAHPDGHLGEDHQPETHLIPIVLQVALGQRTHLDIFGDDYDTPDGTCIRDYVHVCDIAAAHLKVLTVLDERSVRYNVGTGRGYSVRQVVETAEKVIGKPIPVRIAPRRAGDPPVLVADGSRLQRETGWAAALPDLEAMISTAWEWRRRHPNGYAE